MFPTTHIEQWKEMNSSKQKTFNWFKDAKYGMFIHFGLYSKLGGIWKGKKMEEWNRNPLAEWVMYSAQIPRKEYAQIANDFNPSAFDALKIAKLAKAAGMRYIVMTSKHHDGFAMYKSTVSPYNSVDATPSRKDYIQEMYNACKMVGLEFGVYYSHNIDWYDGSDAQASEAMKDTSIQPFFKTFGANLWDTSPNTFDEYLNKKAYPQVKELMERFPDMKLLWYDMEPRMKAEQSFNFYKIVYDIQPQIIITERIGNGFGDYFIPGDNEIPANTDTLKKPWETVGTTNNSWGYKSYDHDFKTPDEIRFWIVDIISKGGNYMLNIGPDGLGNIPKETENSLLSVGNWLKTNAEAIYGTHKWKIRKEGNTNVSITSTEAREKDGFKTDFTDQDFWFTAKGENKVFAISLSKPSTETIIKSFALTNGTIKEVFVLGVGKIPFHQTNAGLSLHIPKRGGALSGFVVKAVFK